MEGRSSSQFVQRLKRLRLQAIEALEQARMQGNAGGKSSWRKARRHLHGGDIARSTTFRAYLEDHYPVIINQTQFKGARQKLRIHGMGLLRKELGGAIDAFGNLDSGELRKNHIARLAVGKVQDPRPAVEISQTYLGNFAEDYLIIHNLDVRAQNWNSEDPQWVGIASMSKHHVMMTLKFFNHVLASFLAFKANML